MSTLLTPNVSILFLGYPRVPQSITIPTPGFGPDETDLLNVPCFRESTVTNASQTLRRRVSGGFVYAVVTVVPGILSTETHRERRPSFSRRQENRR